MPTVKFNRAGVLGDLWFAQFDEREVSDEQFQQLRDLGWIFLENQAYEYDTLTSTEFGRKLPECTVFYSDEKLSAIPETLPEKRMAHFSRGGFQAIAMAARQSLLVQQKVSAKTNIEVKQTLISLGSNNKASVWINGKMADAIGTQTGQNLNPVTASKFVRNTLGGTVLASGENMVLTPDPAYPAVLNVGIASPNTARNVNLTQGEVYTLSFEYQGDIDNFNYCFILSKKNGSQYLGVQVVEPSPDEPRICSITFNANKTLDDAGISVGFTKTDKTTPVQIGKIRLELGAQRRELSGNANYPTDVKLPLKQGDNLIQWLVSAAENGASQLQVLGDFIDDDKIVAA